MNCIICSENANEVGSHIIPASLMKKCIGASDKEESYKIDVKNSNIEVYFGRDNLKNESIEIKPNDYKRDNILCKTCEIKLSELEYTFSKEFLQKFRFEKFKPNFKEKISNFWYEIFEPIKINNEQILAYFYSIILRTCKVYENESKNSYLNKNEILKIKDFLNGYLYKNNPEFRENIKEFNICINFNKYSENGSYIGTLSDLTNPYIFYFCEAIILLFTEEIDQKNKKYYEDVVNNIFEDKSKIVVGSELSYNRLTDEMSKIIAKDIITNGVNNLCLLNNKTYEFNLQELVKLMNIYNSKNIKKPIGQIFDELKNTAVNSGLAQLGF